MTEMPASARGTRGGAHSRSRHAPRTVAAGLIVFAFWLAVSASLALEDLLVGAVLSGLLGWWSARFLWSGAAPWLAPRQVLALLRYLGVFGVEVLRSAAHVARVVLDPRLPIRPRLVVCETRLRSEAARVAFAQSLTLTPGTLTIDMNGGTFLVHCLDEASAAQLLDGTLEARIARVFEPGEDAGGDAGGERAS